MKGHVYRHKPDFFIDEPGWLGVASGTLYFKPGDASSFVVVFLLRGVLVSVIGFQLHVKVSRKLSWSWVNISIFNIRLGILNIF